jgi:hypothetical protein
VNHRSLPRFHRAVGAVACLGSLLLARQAAAEVVLVEKDGWTVSISGRVQAFLNYNNGSGHPLPATVDGNGQGVEFRGGPSAGENYVAYAATPEQRALTPEVELGSIEELRIRTGFVGNVLGFGIKKKLNANTDVLGYTAVTVYIDSTNRRKYMPVEPDWRESFLRLTGPWGALTAGRTLTLFSRGATEITYLYGFSYGLGWPGNVSSISGSGPGAGHVGFGVLGNGFGAGISYATPSLGGFKVEAGLYDANSLVGMSPWERVKWPRPEVEATFEQKLGADSMFKLFVNGAWQKFYNQESPASGAIIGAAGGGRVEFGPVHLGVAGHWGKGIGMDFALQPMQSSIDHRQEYKNDAKLRTYSGYYAQAMVSATPAIDISAGFGVSQLAQNPEDKADSTDDDANPATFSGNDDADPTRPESVKFITIKSQTGISGGVTFHVTENIHVALEYFRAMFQWYLPTPAVAGQTNPKQNFHVVNAGITYAW